MDDDDDNDDDGRGAVVLEGPGGAPAGPAKTKVRAADASAITQRLKQALRTAM